MNNKCSFDGYCLKKGIYKTTVLCSKENKEYIGSTGVSFKVIYNQHKYRSIAWVMIKVTRQHYWSFAK